MNSNNKKNKPKQNARQKKVDLLEEDKPIANQKFVCVSFLSPEKIIEDRNLFYFQEFLKYWDITKSTEKYSQFLNFVSYKYNLKMSDLSADLQDFIDSEKSNMTSSIQDDYKNFVDKQDEILEQQFNKQVDFQTSTRGLKIRGVFPSVEEAEMRCQLLREVDPNHDILVGPVGMWMPWEPEAYKTGRTEYLEQELNELMHQKHTNEQNATQEFESRIREAKTKAIADNKVLASSTGNVLSQDIDADGNLCNAKTNMEQTIEDIRLEVEGEHAIVCDVHQPTNEVLSTETPEVAEIDSKND